VGLHLQHVLFLLVKFANLLYTAFYNNCQWKICLYMYLP
jgi:hypothetical protein